MINVVLLNITKVLQTGKAKNSTNKLLITVI